MNFCVDDFPLLRFSFIRLSLLFSLIWSVKTYTIWPLPTIMTSFLLTCSSLTVLQPPWLFFFIYLSIYHSHWGSTYTYSFCVRASSLDPLTTSFPKFNSEPRWYLLREAMFTSYTNMRIHRLYSTYLGCKLKRKKICSTISSTRTGFF